MSRRSWGVMVLVVATASSARADHAPRKGPSSSTVKRDVKKHGVDVTRVKSVAKGLVGWDDDAERYDWTGDVAYAARSPADRRALDASCRAAYHWDKRWIYDGCAVTWQAYRGVKPPSDAQLAAAMADPDWSAASDVDAALGDPAPTYTKGARWSFADETTAEFPYTVDYWRVSFVDARKRVHATRTALVRFTRPSADATTWTFQGLTWGDPTDGTEGWLPADQQGRDAPTIAMLRRKARFAQIYADWKVPSFDGDRALAEFAFGVLYAAKSPIEWEAFMHQWWPDDGHYFDGTFWWGNQATVLDGDITAGVLGAKAEAFHANYCATATVSQAIARDDGETVFVFGNRAGEGVACTITVSSQLRSKAGARSITDIACDPATGAENLTCP